MIKTNAARILDSLEVNYELQKNYPTFIDESCFLYDFIFISAGLRGLQLKISPDDLVKVAICSIGDLI
jgi:Cys-tRNA(Pro)/Cys-tRNA(Cys) deacylase